MPTSHATSSRSGRRPGPRLTSSYAGACEARWVGGAVGGVLLGPARAGHCRGRQWWVSLRGSYACARSRQHRSGPHRALTDLSPVFPFGRSSPSPTRHDNRSSPCRANDHQHVRCWDERCRRPLPADTPQIEGSAEHVSIVQMAAEALVCHPAYAQLDRYPVQHSVHHLRSCLSHTR
jgi:hypothetical protein